MVPAINTIFRLKLNVILECLAYLIVSVNGYKMLNGIFFLTAKFALVSHK